MQLTQIEINVCQVFPLITCYSIGIVGMNIKWWQDSAEYIFFLKLERIIEFYVIRKLQSNLCNMCLKLKQLIQNIGLADV